mgnify:CR=1 FL=1
MDITDLRQLIATELAEVHTCLPGVIVGYDGSMATVKPTLDKRLANGESLPAPKIARVPICWPIAANGAAVTVPLQVGDQVLLHFCERALEDWLMGSDGPPGDPRQFDLSDAFATPIMRPGRTADTVNVSVQHGAGSIKIAPDGSVVIVAPSVRFEAPMVTMTGNLNILGTTLGAGVNLNTHVHTGVESGPDNSGPPVPGT